MSIRAGSLGGGRRLGSLAGGVSGAPRPGRPEVGAPGGAWRASEGGCAPTFWTPWRPKKTWPCCGATPGGRTPGEPDAPGAVDGGAPRPNAGNVEMLESAASERSVISSAKLSSFIHIVSGRPNPPENADISSATPSSPRSSPSPRPPFLPFSSLSSFPSWSLPSSNTSFLSLIVELVPPDVRFRPPGASSTNVYDIHLYYGFPANQIPLSDA